MPIKKRRKSAKKLASLRAARRRDAKKQAAIDKRLALQAATKKPTPISCQHPRSRARGGCVRPAILGNDKQPILFVIPDAYIPATRHSFQPELPRPHARLCVQHKFLLDAYLERDEGRPKDFPHRSQCPVCRHPKCDDITGAWVNWQLTTSQSAAILGVSRSSFTKHCDYYGLNEKRSTKDATRNFHLRVMDEGLERGGATIKDAIASAAQLSKERGDVQNVDMRMAVRDLSNLSDKELAAEMKAAALALEQSSKEQGV